MKKQFNLDEWLHDKSRKLMTRTGEPVEIINHEVMGKYCIYAKATWQDGEIFNICTTSNGEAYEGEETAYDLFFADEEDELTEFEKEVKDLMNSCCNEIGEADITNEWAKEAAANLLDLTRKELGLVDNTCGEYALNEAYKQGKQDALKDLPKLEKTKDVIDPTIPVMYTYAATNKTYVEYDGHKLCINDAFEKLPKEE